MNFERLTQESEAARKRMEKLNWTEKEDDTIVNAYIKFGADWKQISENYVSRPPSQIKNRINCKIRKLLHRINFHLRQIKKKVQKHCFLKFMFFTSIEMTIWVTPDEKMKYQYLRKQLIAKYLLEPNTLTYPAAKQIFEICGYFNINFRNTQMKSLSRRDPAKPIISNKVSQQRRGMNTKSKDTLKQETNQFIHYPLRFFSHISQPSLDPHCNFTPLLIIKKEEYPQEGPIEVPLRASNQEKNQSLILESVLKEEEGEKGPIIYQ